MSRKTSHIYEFGPFRLDPSVPLLLREGEPVAATLKALETLAVLVERGGQVVSREELIEAVWPDTVVEENNLSVNVSALRKVLGEGSSEEKYIETVPRRGYRFSAPVRALPIDRAEVTFSRRTRSEISIEESIELDPAVATAPGTTLVVTPTAGTAPTRSRFAIQKRWPALLALAVTLAAAITGAILIKRGWESKSNGSSARKDAAVVDANGTTIRSLAVLPFSDEETDDFGATGYTELTDVVVAGLRAMGNVSVIPQSSVLAQKMTRNNLLVAGRKLQADAVLIGTVFKNDAESIKVRLHLVSVNGGETLWADTFEGTHASVVDALGRNVPAGLNRLRSAAEYDERARRHTPNREAYQHYLQGRFLWEQRNDVFAANYINGSKDPINSINQLEQARALDPNFALPYVALADHYKVAGYSPGEWRRGEEYALKAIALDPNLAEAHATLGFIRMLHYWDWDGSESEYKRALELDPDCVTAHQWYALFHALRGNHLESIKEITRARELAPYSLMVQLDAAEMQYYRASAANLPMNNVIEPLLRLRVQREHSVIKAALMNAYLMQAQWEGARGQYALDLAIAVHAEFNYKGATNAHEFARFMLGLGNCVYGSAGFRNEDSWNCARWLTQFDEREKALDMLELAHETHHFFIIYARAEPFLKPLHDEPRYKALLEKLNLPPV